jgi:hypothetical protein
MDATCTYKSCKAPVRADDPHSRCLRHVECYVDHTFNPADCAYCLLVFERPREPNSLWSHRMKLMLNSC